MRRFVCSMLFFLPFQTKTTLEERVQTLVDENASLEFQCNNMKESNNSGLKRFNSYNSTEFLARSTQNLGEFSSQTCGPFY